MSEIFEFYEKINTQWVIGGGMVSVPIGLNYQSVSMVAKVYKFNLTSLRMDAIRKIESEYIRSLHG